MYNFLCNTYRKQPVPNLTKQIRLNNLLNLSIIVDEYRDDSPKPNKHVSYLFQLRQIDNCL